MIYATHKQNELNKAAGRAMAVLKRLATAKGAVLYVIRNSRAGWAVQWYEENRQTGNDFETGLVIYKYHTTFAMMLRAETARLKALPEKGISFLLCPNMETHGIIG
jgi:type IV secretory pathway TrbF-like protein